MLCQMYVCVYVALCIRNHLMSSLELSAYLQKREFLLSKNVDAALLVVLFSDITVVLGACSSRYGTIRNNIVKEQEDMRPEKESESCIDENV